MLFFTTFFGCASVGPDYTPPENRAPASWHTEIGPGLATETTDPRRIAGWWVAFNDPVLIELMDRAVKNNLDLNQAMAKVREARARSGISWGGQFPILDVSAATGKSKGSENSGGGATRNFFSVGFDAGWEVDIFGGVRRSIEASEADFSASLEALQDVLVTLSAELGRNYLDVRIIQARLSVAEENIALQQQTYDLILAQCQAGLSSELAQQQARYNLENTRARIPTLRGSLEEATNRLAVLTGNIPGGVHELLAERRPIPVVSATVTVGVPAETLRQRPDIRRAERSLAAQSARVGVATANLYPKFRLAGSIGLESLSSADLFTSSAETWNIRPSVSWNIFDAGVVRRNIEVQSAIQEQYLFAYEATVLAALEEVENTLSAYAEELRRRKRLLVAVDAARLAATLARNEYDAGLTDFTSVLDAQRALLSFEEQLTESQGSISINLIRLYKALGGGWDSVTSTDMRDTVNKEETK